MSFGAGSGQPINAFRFAATTGNQISANTALGLSIGKVSYWCNQMEIATNITTSMILTTGINATGGANTTLCYVPGYGSGFSGKLDRGNYAVDTNAILYLNSVGAAITTGEIIINLFK